MAKETNKEESDRCIQIAMICFHEGHKDKALNFLRKAEKLCPSRKIENLIRQVESMTENFSENVAKDYGAFDHYENAGIRNRFHAPNDASASAQSTESRADASDNNNSKNHSDQNFANSSRKFRSDFDGTRDRSRSPHVRSSKTGGAGSSSTSFGHRVTSAPQLGVDYTEEQEEAVHRIRLCKDYYDTFGVTKDFSEDELKKQYKKLALKLHPDKNRAPGSAEAFKAVGNAYAVLSNPEKRQRYDMYGGNGTPLSNSSYNHDEYDESRGSESDMTPDEIFNMFFGGGFHSGRHSAGDSTEHNSSLLFQLLPLLVLVLLSVFGQFLVADPVFRLQRTGKYTDQRVTRDMRVVYYVKPEFLKSYHNSLHRIERLVEEEYVNDLRTNCFNERAHKEAMLWRARAYGDSGLYEKALTLNTPSCDRLSEIYA